MKNINPLPINVLRYVGVIYRNVHDFEKSSHYIKKSIDRSLAEKFQFKEDMGEITAYLKATIGKTTFEDIFELIIQFKELNTTWFEGKNFSEALLWQNNCVKILGILRANEGKYELSVKQKYSLGEKNGFMV